MYTKGFYTSSSQSVKKPGSHDTTASFAFIKNIKPAVKKQNTPALLAQVSKAILPVPYTNFFLPTTVTCDTIILKNGTKLVGNITKINSKKIFFKSCNLPDSAMFYVNKTEVNHVNFADGLTNISDFKNSNKPSRKLAIMGLIIMF